MPPAALQHGVIVADDSEIVRSNLRTILGENWHVFLAVDGVQAVEYARRINAELVVLDFRMPRLDGVDACATIRSMPNYATVPIVLLTAYDSHELRRRAVQARVTAVFGKPFTANQLREALMPLLALGRDAVARGLGTAAPEDIGDHGLDVGRDVLTVYRKVDQAAEQRRYVSFPEVMAARRVKLLR